ncbi:hypothetical protein URH17368_2942 [Alicyclobacillus hesperidum URH17-3-68]|uniref:hypothetical protein n=1 Tax=Alicyclobacillus hesperidum TaxID=89784 RepID=UPI000281C253|nr:hypothetical protein [Alicyclobacillus hesperidum]EJY54474.1 hypothetical protein URH17368_2942 [Alicyclobacillus hesperidum URH17-3-68]
MQTQNAHHAFIGQGQSAATANVSGQQANGSTDTTQSQSGSTTVIQSQDASNSSSADGIAIWS